MTMKNDSRVDETGMQILSVLQKNARATFSEIGRQVGLSSPAVAERVYKMEEAGILKGYHARINPAVFNHRVQAFIFLTIRPEQYESTYAFAEKENQILECHHISGRESLILKAACAGIPELDRLVESLGRFGETQTAIVLSSPILKTELMPV